jgi:hypothetical protein
LNSETWRHLLALESRDNVSAWHKKIVDRTLSERRVIEIISAAKQSREFFRNASEANNTVRPLLSYYGVASLSRALLLLLKPGPGESSLTASHGLGVVNWRATLGADISTGLSNLKGLKICTNAGLFNDFVQQTKNKVCLHIRSSAVDWAIDYGDQPLNSHISLGDILTRLPDLSSYLPAESERNCAWINSLEFNGSQFKVKSPTDKIEALVAKFTAQGYTSAIEGNHTVLEASTATLERFTPLFVHNYVKKSFGSIPSLHLATPIGNGLCYSELALTFMLSYFLGMLTRYFPTQWVALANGAKGDEIWPAINAAQNLIESSFPELVHEFIQYKVSHPDRQVRA